MSAALVQLLDTYQSMVLTFSDFFAAAVHLILFQREVYPRDSFTRVRKYNFPVWQSRHPGVCRWVSDAVAAVETQALKGVVARASLLILSKDQTLLERYVFSTEGFPALPASDVLARLKKEAQPDDTDPEATEDDRDDAINLEEAAREGESENSSEEDEHSPQEYEEYDSRQSTPSPEQASVKKPSKYLPMVELTSQFAGVYSRLVHVTESLAALPKSSTFTIAIELRNSKPTSLPTQPVDGNWVTSAAETKLRSLSDPFTSGNGKQVPETAELARVQASSFKGGPQDRKMVPLRAVAAEPFYMEAWMEHAGSTEHGNVQPSVHGRRDSVHLEYDDL